MNILTRLSDFLGNFLEQQQDSQRIEDIKKERKNAYNIRRIHT